MIIPKEFQGMYDLESMLMTSLLGLFISLREDLISLNQAQSYWLSDTTVEIFQQVNLSEDIIHIVQEGCQLSELGFQSEEYFKKIDELIAQSKSIISKHYTEYEDIESTGVIN